MEAVRMNGDREDLFHSWEAVQRKFGYTQAIRAGNFVYVSGTASLDEDFALLHPGDLLGQMQVIYARIGDALAHFSIGHNHIVRETMYVTDIDALMPAMDYRKSIYGDGPFPTSTTVEVSRLFVPGMLIEIETTAYIPE
jgi:2-iminobutanoate/2-iminopropanoate deaminase